MLRRISVFCQIVFLLLLTVASADAALTYTIVFDNFAPNDGYNCCSGWTISNNYSNNTFTQGSQFTPSASGYVSDIWVGANLVQGPNVLQVALMTDSGGQPGTVIERWNFSGKMGTFNFINPPLHGRGNGKYIYAGQKYWLIATAPADGTWAAWNQNSTADNGPLATKDQSEGFGGPWTIDPSQLRGAFRVAVTSDPVEIPTMTEWGMMIFAAFAVIGAVYYLRRQRRAVS